MMKISVIVPVYRVEAYLKECIDSILNQEFSDYEILLIDDGSPDQCGDICDEYAQQNACIRVFHQENKGVSAARNLGMEMAVGEWLMFVDPDDWLEDNALNILYQRAVETQCDVVCASFYRNYPDRQVTAWPEGIGEKTYSVRENRQFLFECVTYRAKPQKEAWMCSPCWKLYRAELLREHKIIFPVGLKIVEDALFNLHVICHAESVHLIDVPVYHYRMRGSSASRTVLFEDLQCRIIVMRTFMEKHQIVREFQPYYYRHLAIEMVRFIRLRCGDVSGILTFHAMVREAQEFSDSPECRRAVERTSFKGLPIKQKVGLFLLKRKWYKVFIVVSVMYHRLSKDRKTLLWK